VPSLPVALSKLAVTAVYNYKLQDFYKPSKVAIASWSLSESPQNKYINQPILSACSVAIN